MAAQDRHDALKAKIRSVYAAHRGLYGYRRITLAIRGDGELVNHKKVQRLMKELGMRSRVRRKKFRSYQGEVGEVAPNLLNREFTASRPNEKWVTDVAEFRVAGKSRTFLRSWTSTMGKLLPTSRAICPISRW